MSLCGAPVAVTTAAMLGISGWALHRSRLLSSWAARLSWVMAIVVVATLHALYQGDDLKGIYSADGLVADVLAFVPLFVWTLAVSIAVLRKAPAVQS